MQQMSLHTELILPTTDAIAEFVLDTESMSVIDYDLDEVLSNIFVALAAVQEIEYRMTGFFQMYQRWGEGKNTYGIPDGEILSKAFLKLLRNILDIYKRIGMWDGSGFCPYYYKGRDRYDCVLGLLD